jgi:uncharacterized protein (DUF3084 family)
MTKLDYLEQLEGQLEEIDAGLQRAETALAEGRTGEREKALAELADLRLRRDAIEKRIEEAKSKGADAWSDLHVSFREEMDGLADTVERFLTRHA